MRKRKQFYKKVTFYGVFYKTLIEINKYIKLKI